MNLGLKEEKISPNQPSVQPRNRLLIGPGLSGDFRDLDDIEANQSAFSIFFFIFLFRYGVNMRLIPAKTSSVSEMYGQVYYI
jgi:hypothetical protein